MLQLTDNRTAVPTYHEISPPDTSDITLPQEVHLASLEQVAGETTELTEQDKQTVDRSLSIISAYTNDSSGSHQTRYLRMIRAESDVLLIGRKVLPYLKEKIFDDPHSQDPYLYSRYVAELAKREDLNLVLDSFESPGSYQNSDGSSLQNIIRTLSRLSVEIRNQNAHDPRLNEIANRIITAMNRQPPGCHPLKQTVYYLLGITGTPEARRYLTRNRSDVMHVFAPSAYEYLDSIDNIDPIFTHTTGEFQTAEDVLAARRRSGESYTNINGYLQEIDDEHTVPQPLGSLEIIQDVSNHDETFHRVEQLIATELANVEPTAVPAIKLHLYNFIAHHPQASQDEIDKELYKMHRLSDYEKQFSEHNHPLPTIGIEIEIPNEYVSGSKRQALTDLGIPNYEEGNSFFEVNPDFSYSPWVQARVLQELTELGAIPLEKRTHYRQNGESFVRKHFANWGELSLHINLGIPPEINGKTEDYDNELYTLSDAFAIAYTSPERIDARKTHTSLKLNDASPSKKTVIGETADEGTNAEIHPFRLELRAHEFHDYPTYRLLAEVQSLAGCLFASIKEREGLPVTEEEKQLSEIWDSFFMDTGLELSFKQISTNDIDNNRFQIIKAMKETEIKERLRGITHHYAQRAKEILEPKKVTVPS